MGSPPPQSLLCPPRHTLPVYLHLSPLSPPPPPLPVSPLTLCQSPALGQLPSPGSQEAQLSRVAQPPPRPESRPPLLTPSPADQGCRPGAHLLATSLSLRHLKPTATHSDFLLLTTGRPPTPLPCSLTEDGTASPPGAGPLLSGAPSTVLFYLGTPGSFFRVGSAASAQVPSPEGSSDNSVL